ncbi:lipid kinase, YegS/Rv2252/BmrU family [Anaerosphaera aminiphila DSM 21120]|uniref:Lipid kinase, YegS/Rv2252/BmrU family n=1 Tax=Anaerosphaera aminiphila DSM 21120 TaxID=1120995 RepID=A0A1M5PHH4_9FIRM|nr:diacylglycerol kinase family protein [Anaerosphaera aminiphila]SHH01274.1 lipid kinase, YegS/Rv2252/BmrU family [Anaerosphaera aminiphila DSM 21120]
MYYFIVNPNARAGQGEKVWSEIEKILNERKIEYNYFYTKGEEDAKNIAFELSSSLKEESFVIVLGGDGTLNEVINGLINLNLITLGVVPIGSGNDFVRSFKSKINYRDYINIVLSPKKIVEYNICKMKNLNGERKFIVSSGIGFDASITNEVNNSRNKLIYTKTPIKNFIYAICTLKILFTYRPLEIKLFEEDKVNIFKNAYFSVVMNTAYEGKAVMLCPEAKGYDDYIDICIMNTSSKLKVVLLTLSAFFGKHAKSRNVYISKGKYFKMECSDETHCHIDGEQFGKSDWTEYSILEKKIKVIVP